MLERLLLFAGLLVLLGILQAGAWLVARGLGRRLERHVLVLGAVLPLLVLAPWLLDPSRLLFPGDFLRHTFPGVADLPGTDRHELLNDAVFQMIPWELEVRHALKDGRLPLWSDLLEGGSSPWINPQASVLSPLALLARPVPIQHWLLALLALKIQLAFQGTWLLLRSLGARRLASLLAAAGFSLAGGVMAWALFPLSSALAWVPWLTVGVIGLFRERLRPRRIATVALLTGALVLSGHPETAAIGGLFAAVCGVSLRARRRPLAAGFSGAALAALLGFGLAAPLLVPFLRHLPESQRAQETVAETMPVLHPTAWHPYTWFVPEYRTFLLGPVNPRIYGRPYQDEFGGPLNWAEAESGYAGLIAFAGALLAALCVRRRRVWPFLGFAIMGLLLAAKFLPFAWLIHRVDALQTLSYPRFLSVATLALSVAAGLAIDHLLRRPREGWGLRLPVLAGAAAASLLGHADAWVVLLWSLIAAAAGLAAWRPRWGAAVLGAALLLDLVPWAWSLLPAGNPGFFYPPSPYFTRLHQETERDGPWRAVGEDFAMYPSLLAVYGVADVRPHNPLAPMTYLHELRAAFGFHPTMVDYFAPLNRVEHPFLDFLNVCCVVWESANPVPAGWPRLDDGGSSLRLYRNPDALPRWFVPARIDVIEPAALTGWITALDDGRRVAVFRGGREPLPPVPPAAEIRALRVDPGRIELEVTALRETVVATSLLQPQGWTARSAGRPLPKLTVNGAFLGLRVPPGTHRIELRYLPPGFVPGMGLGGLSLLVCGLLLLRRGRKVEART